MHDKINKLCSTWYYGKHNQPCSNNNDFHDDNMMHTSRWFGLFFGLFQCPNPWHMGGKCDNKEWDSNYEHPFPKVPKYKRRSGIKGVDVIEFRSVFQGFHVGGMRGTSHTYTIDIPLSSHAELWSRYTLPSVTSLPQFYPNTLGNICAQLNSTSSLSHSPLIYHMFWHLTNPPKNSNHKLHSSNYHHYHNCSIKGVDVIEFRSVF